MTNAHPVLRQNIGPVFEPQISLINFNNRAGFRKDECLFIYKSDPANIPSKTKFFFVLIIRDLWKSVFIPLCHIWIRLCHTLVPLFSLPFHNVTHQLPSTIKFRGFPDAQKLQSLRLNYTPTSLRLICI